MLYAKSKPDIESIKQHTDKLLDNLELLKKLYGDKILENKTIDKDRFWCLLKLVCKYHDIGKVYTPFQNIILKDLGMEQLQTEFSYDYIKHEQLSPMFIPYDDLNLTNEELLLIMQSIYYHHEREKSDLDSNLVEKIIENDILPRMDKIQEEVRVPLNNYLDSYYLRYVKNAQRIREVGINSKLYTQYCLIKGLLHRIDHNSSANLPVEDNTQENIKEYILSFFEQKNSFTNDIQNFASSNYNKNIVVIGSTGIGKTEAALLWSNGDKTFFTLPLRISINAIYDRIYKELGYKSTGLLHSTALDYLDNKEEFGNIYSIYEQSKNLTYKITTCTIDQLFPFVFKYKGYEKIYSTMSYSKVVIDEIQAYSPSIVAVVLKGLNMINNIGGKFMVMTATLPRIYKDELDKMGIEFEYGEFLKESKRHKIKLENKNISEDIDFILENNSDKKVLIIVNTINKAIEIYNIIKQRNIENVNLLHSRFIQKDRTKKEEEIKKFSLEKEKSGIWITTQIVEASIDIDFDLLYTEMSTLDSLFQRLGRCYRRREYYDESPNVYIYNANASGIKSVYDEEIHKKSIELLRKYDGYLLEEKTKVDLVDKLYSKEELEKTKFYEEFLNSMKVLENIVDYDISKKDSQKILRNIDTIAVIPDLIYNNNLELFQNFLSCNDYTLKNKLKREINKLTTTISKRQSYSFSGYLSEIKGFDNIKRINLKYDSDIGLILKRDEEYDLNDRMC